MDRTIRTVCIIIFVCAVSAVSAYTDAELCARAQVAYEHGAWQEAQELYGAMACKACSVWYNMGNCAFQDGNRINAIILWKRALLGAPFALQCAIEQNLSVAYDAIGRTPSDIPLSRFARWVYRIPLRSLQLIFLMCWYALWFLFWYAPRRRTFLFYGTFVSICCLLLVTTALLIGSYRLHAYEYGHVTKKEAQLFAGPHEQYHAVGTVALLDELQILQKRTGWYKVMGGDRYGWIPSADVTVV